MLPAVSYLMVNALPNPAHKMHFSATIWWPALAQGASPCRMKLGTSSCTFIEGTLMSYAWMVNSLSSASRNASDFRYELSPCADSVV